MKRIIVLLNLILLTLLAYVAVNSFYMIAANQLALIREPGELEDEKAQLAGTETPPLSAYDPIIRRNPFGTGTPKTAQTKQVYIEELDKTTLELKLWGTVIGGQGETYAVIERTDQKKQMLYKEGDQVAQATVKFILRDKVILTVDGKDQILEMEQNSAGRAMGPQIRNRRQPGDTRQVPSSQTGKQEIVLKRDQINKAVSNVNELMTQVVITPHFDVGKSGPSGLALSGINETSVFRQMGLQDGDIIVGVDGKAIRTLDDALSLYKNLRTQDRVKLQIKRRGQMEQLQYAIE